jgi:chemotaxis response regulator CheB
MNHDIIVIGGSAGGVGVLLGLVPELPANLPAAILVVVHTSPAGPGVLPDLLTARGRLPASRASRKARTQTEQAELIRQILLHGALLSRSDASALDDGAA